jgi:hypothetical protein
MITLSNHTYDLVHEYTKDDPSFTGKMEQVFDAVDAVHGGVIPQEDLGEGTYQWVCNYGGGKFYTRIDNEDSIWLRDGI